MSFVVVTEQFGKDSDEVLPQQSWIVFDALSSVIFVEVYSQILGRCEIFFTKL